MEKNKELQDIIFKFFNNVPDKIVGLTIDQKRSIVLLTILSENIKEKVLSVTKEIRDDLITIRTLMDENPTKAKQLTTNLIKELK
jgi:uncharacterized protein (UPF0264 family)